MKNECSIVRDILPLYSEGMVSKETASFIEEHLEDCSDCREELESIKKASEIDSAFKAGFDKQKNDAQPIRKIKRKFRIRLVLTIILAVVFTLGSIAGYINLMPVSIDRGSSELYYQDDINTAIEIIKDKVNSMHGCKLYSLSYKGDIYSMQELEYCNRLNQDGEPYTECIVFGSCFRTPIWGGEGFSSNTLEYWSWYLARTENGTWQLVAWGYP